MSLQALLITNTSLNIQPAGNSLQPAIGGMTGMGGNVEQWSEPAFGAVACPVASPGVWTGLQLPNGQQVVLGGTSVPTGFTLGNTYFVVNTNLPVYTFQLSATSGGGAINATGAAAVGATAKALQPPTVTADVTIASNIPFETGERVVVGNPSAASLILQQSDDNATWRTAVVVQPFSFAEVTLFSQYIRVSTAATLVLLAA